MYEDDLPVFCLVMVILAACFMVCMIVMCRCEESNNELVTKIESEISKDISTDKTPDSKLVPPILVNTDPIENDNSINVSAIPKSKEQSNNSIPKINKDAEGIDLVILLFVLGFVFVFFNIIFTIITCPVLLYIIEDKSLVEYLNLPDECNGILACIYFTT
jgi:Ca2+/Na+ antiporter